MDRRKFLATAFGGGVTALSGCSSFGNFGQNNNQGPALKPGLFQNPLTTTVRHEGLEVTVSDFKVYDRILGVTEKNQGSGGDSSTETATQTASGTPTATPTPTPTPDYIRPPTAGGAFLLLKVEIEHVGEVKRHIPYQNDIFLWERENQRRLFPLRRNVNVNKNEHYQYIRTPDGEYYENYFWHVKDKKGDTRGVFPDVSLSGWVAAEVSETFDKTEIWFDLAWGKRIEDADILTPDTPEGGGASFRQRFRWQLLTPDEATPTPSPTPTPSDDGGWVPWF